MATYYFWMSVFFILLGNGFLIYEAMRGYKIYKDFTLSFLCALSVFLASPLLINFLYLLSFKTNIVY